MVNFTEFSYDHSTLLNRWKLIFSKFDGEKLHKNYWKAICRRVTEYAIGRKQTQKLVKHSDIERKHTENWLGNEKQQMSDWDRMINHQIVWAIGSISTISVNFFSSSSSFLKAWSIWYACMCTL